MTDTPDVVVIDPQDLPMTRRQARRTLLLCGAVLGLLLSGLIGAAGYQFWQASQTTKAVCAFRADLQTRADSGRKFLEEHPKGLRDIPAKTIEESVRNQERTINALRFLSCPPVPDPAPTATPTLR